MWLVIGGVLALGLTARPAAAQALSSADRDAIVKQHTSRGGRADELPGVFAVVDGAEARGLPTLPIVNKIREGIAKGVAVPRIDQTVRQMASNLDTADRLLRDGASEAVVNRTAAVVLLADALAGGLTPDAIREIRKQAQSASLSGDVVAGAARGLAFISSAKLPVAEGTGVVVEAVRRGYQPQELVDLGREVKRRERDYQSGRATLRTLRDAIARGDRPERLFREPVPVERPAQTRPEATVVPERPVRPSVPERPAPPARPETPERPLTR